MSVHWTSVSSSLSASALAAVALLGIAGCEDPGASADPAEVPVEAPAEVTKPDEPTTATAVTATAASGRAAFKVPDEASIPAGEQGELTRRGKLLATRTHEELPENVGNGLHCSSCHIGAGTTPKAGPWVGISARFPQYRSRAGREITLEERINSCFQRSMNGKPLDESGPDMRALVAYMDWLSQGYEKGATIEGQGIPKLRLEREPDPEKGKALYATRCAGCHAADGKGLTAPDGAYAFPALWGDDSYNIAAGMARLHTAAGFVKHNMPLGAGGTLTDDEAWDIAGYFAFQARPDFAGKVNDWPKGNKPADARY